MQINEKVYVMFEGTIEKIEKINHYNGDGGHEIFVTVRSEMGPSGSSVAIVDMGKVNLLKDNMAGKVIYK